MSKLFFVIISLLQLKLALAQQLKHYSFTHYTTASGLTSNQVNTAVQDDEGYIWMGTTNGLQRFDGIRYKTFIHKDTDSSSIPSNPVWQLLIDKKKNLWLLMADGKVGIFNSKKFIFRQVPAHFRKPVSPNTSLKRLIADEYGHVFYLISESEVITLNEKGIEFSYKHNFFRQKEEWEVVDFIPEPGSKKYWISLKDGGMAVYNNQTGKLSYPGQNLENEPLIDKYNKSSNYYNLYFDRQHRLWNVNSGRIFSVQCYDFKTNKLVIQNLSLISDIKTYHEIRGFFQQQDGTVWIRGLLVFAKYMEAEKKFQPVYNGFLNEQSIAYEMVHCLFEDHEKSIWVCTDNSGIFRFNPSTEYFINIKHTNRISGNKGEGRLLSFVPAKGGTFLAGTWGDGLYQYDENGNSLPLNIEGLAVKSKPSIWSMLASRDSNIIWMGAEPGIYAIDQANHSSRYYNPPVLKYGTVRQIAEDKNGNLWIGMSSTGVLKWSAANGRNRFEEGITAFTAIPPVQVNKITIDSRGYIWVGTPENGVYVIDPVCDKLAMRFSDTSQREKKLPERGVSSILEYNDSIILITTATRVFSYNRLSNKSSIIGKQEMISGFITAIEKDQQGYLWLSSTSGLYRINIKKEVIFKFSEKNGLENDHFTQSASCVLHGGKMLFGTTNDFVFFDPAKIRIISPVPDIHITDFKVMGNSLPVDSVMSLKEVELGYQDNSVSIEFSPLIYNSTYLINYKLERLDKYWKKADKNNEAIYSFLPPGSYKFLLKSIDEEGNESRKITQLTITVNPPFWKTWWFYGLLVLAIAALLFWLDRERIKRKEAVGKMRSDIADKLYLEVHTVLSNINILSEMAKLKADKDTEKSKDFIQQIHSKSQQMIIAMDDVLWGIKPENDSMQKTIERFKEHIDSLRNRNNVKIDLWVDEKVEELKLNMKTRQTVFWLLKSGSTNMVKTGATNCKFSIKIKKSSLIYILEFDNSHSDLQQLNNILQRQELARKIAEVKGKLNIQMQDSISVIELCIPV